MDPTILYNTMIVLIRYLGWVVFNTPADSTTAPRTAHESRRKW